VQLLAARYILTLGGVFMENELFGKKGIDTEYEREFFETPPHLEFHARILNAPLFPDVKQNIVRAKDFTVSKSIMDYQSLIDRIQKLLDILQDRNLSNEFQVLLGLLSNEPPPMNDIIQHEEQYNTIAQDNGDLELYTILFRVKNTLNKRVNFIMDYLKNQFSSADEVKKIEEDELVSIQKWFEKEVQLSNFYHEMAHDEDATDGEVKNIEKEAKKLEGMHTTLADISYVDRNRYLMLEEVVNMGEAIVLYPENFIKKDLHMLLDQLAKFPDLRIFKSHLLFSFKQVKDEHKKIKHQFVLMDEAKELFISEKQYFYQKFKSNTSYELREWLYTQQEEFSEALDKFAGYMVESIKNVEDYFSKTLTDLIKYYRQEAIFYYKQMELLRKKEEIRRFYKIIEDLRDIGQIDADWIDRYLEVNGYQDSQIS